MAATNRWNHWIEELEELLETVEGLTVIKSFDKGKWTNYRFPWAYVAIAPEEPEAAFDDGWSERGVTEFWIEMGIDVATNEDIRKAANNLAFSVNKLFWTWVPTTLSTDYFTLYTDYARLTGYASCPADGSTKASITFTGQFGWFQENLSTGY